MLTRREWLSLTMATGAAAALDRLQLAAQQPLIMRAIPSSAEQVPAVGLGTSATYTQVAKTEDVTALREVLKALVSGGGTVIDTAPAYGIAEEVSGRLAAEEKITDRIFWATKVNVVRGRGGSATADPAAARAQIDTSFARIKKARVDCIQVHNHADVATQLGILNEYKKQGRVRYVGVTTTFPAQFGDLVATMKSTPMDFIGINYAIDDRDVEQTILPLAAERRIGVLVYLPFGRTRLFKRVSGQPLPDYAKEFDATTWAQFFLKYLVSHPAVTVVTPATTQARNMTDNLGAARGRLPNAELRKRMVGTIDALPGA
jgi:aryl-alcohol dehydrogenase-like predicted oxidoreductase